MLVYSPLESFEILVYIPLKITSYIDLSITQFFFVFFLISLIFLAMFDEYFADQFFSRRNQFVVERLYIFLITMLREQTGSAGIKYFPFIWLAFFFVLFSNLIGLLPFSFTVTSHFSITFAFALAFNVAFIIIGFEEHGLKFLNLFVPKNVPMFLLPLIILIEVVSYLMRTLSLSLRLFANMMAGHTLLHILASSIVGILSFNFVILYPILVTLPLIVMLAVLLLELGIAFIQAYVFGILLCIYLNDSLHPSH